MTQRVHSLPSKQKPAFSAESHCSKSGQVGRWCRACSGECKSCFGVLTCDVGEFSDGTLSNGVQKCGVFLLFSYFPIERLHVDDRINVLAQDGLQSIRWDCLQFKHVLAMLGDKTLVP